MTTLSTLIGPTVSSLGMGEIAPAKAPFWKRLGGAFRGKRKPNDVSSIDLTPAEALKEVIDDAAPEARDDDSVSDSVDEVPQFDLGGPLLPPNPPRRRMLWGNGRRDVAMDEVRTGIGALASLLSGIQNNMEQQGARQNELIACLSHLPIASAVQTESLQAIRDQIEQGASHQSRLCSALERLGGIQETTGEALTSISRRIDQMDSRDAGFTQSMEKVCDAMQTVSRASETGALVLNRVQNALSNREEGMQLTLDKHQSRFTALMAIAISVSAGALAVVAAVGYLVITKVH